MKSNPSRINWWQKETLESHRVAKSDRDSKHKPLKLIKMTLKNSGKSIRCFNSIPKRFNEKANVEGTFPKKCYSKVVQDPLAAAAYNTKTGLNKV